MGYEAQTSKATHVGSEESAHFDFYSSCLYDTVLS
jgi:hypothetical protein